MFHLLHSKKDQRNANLLLFVGWFGVLLNLTAYGLIIFEVLPVTSFWYLGMNIVSAAAIVIPQSFHRDYAQIFINVVWALVAVVGLVRIIIQL